MATAWIEPSWLIEHSVTGRRSWRKASTSSSVILIMARWLTPWPICSLMVRLTRGAGRHALPDRQRLEPAGERARRDPPARGVGHEVGHHPEQLLDHDPALQPGRGRAQAVVGPGAERQHPPGAPPDVEDVGVGPELARVAVGRGVEEVHLVPGRDRGAARPRRRRVVVRDSPWTGEVIRSSSSTAGAIEPGSSTSRRRSAGYVGEQRRRSRRGARRRCRCRRRS